MCIRDSAVVAIALFSSFGNRVSEDLCIDRDIGILRHSFHRTLIDTGFDKEGRYFGLPELFYQRFDSVSYTHLASPSDHRIRFPQGRQAGVYHSKSDRARC